MFEQHFLSVFEQVVGHLREEIIRGGHRVLCLTVGVCDRDTAGSAEGGSAKGELSYPPVAGAFLGMMNSSTAR
jgi:hypothetical protein